MLSISWSFYPYVYADLKWFIPWWLKAYHKYAEMCSFSKKSWNIFWNLRAPQSADRQSQLSKYFKTGDNGCSVKILLKFVRSTFRSGCHWQHSCCTLNAELSCNWEEKSNISRKRCLSGMEQAEPKHSQKKIKFLQTRNIEPPKKLNFWGLCGISSVPKFASKFRQEDPGGKLWIQDQMSCKDFSANLVLFSFGGWHKHKIGYSGSATLCFFSSPFFGEFWHKCDRVVNWCSNPTHACWPRWCWWVKEN